MGEKYVRDVFHNTYQKNTGTNDLIFVEERMIGQK